MGRRRTCSCGVARSPAPSRSMSWTCWWASMCWAGPRPRARTVWPGSWCGTWPWRSGEGEGYFRAFPLMAASPPLRLQTLVLITGAVLMGIKLMAWRVTGSNTILGDALESVVNLVAGGFALYSLTLAAKPRDPEHPYGHGKVEFISAGLEGGMVIMAGALIIWRSVQALRTEQVVSELGT